MRRSEQFAHFSVFIACRANKALKNFRHLNNASSFRRIVNFENPLFVMIKRHSFDTLNFVTRLFSERLTAFNLIDLTLFTIHTHEKTSRQESSIFQL